MSWSEVKKINSNLSKPLDTLITEKVDEVKTATASQTSINTVTTSIGETNNTGGTATAGSIFAKLNKLLTDWTTARAGKIDSIDTDIQTVKTNVNTLVNGRVVKSVQYGVATNLATGSGRTISYSAVDISKSMILIEGHAGNNAQLFIKSRTATSFTVANTFSITSNSEFSWHVIEFY